MEVTRSSSTRSNDSLEVTSRACREFGCDPATLKLHRERIQDYLRRESAVTFQILDTCRFDNGGIIRVPKITEADELSGFVAFVPAAGAASRYMQSLAKRGDSQSLSLAQQNTPKALVPAVSDGATFLDLKILEHRGLRGLVGQIFVAGRDATQMFRAALAHKLESSDAPVLIKEQRDAMCTVRFDRDGLVVEDTPGVPSIVPAGHGALVQLFHPVRFDFPSAHSLFIRNVDNISGMSFDVVSEMRTFLAWHQKTLGWLRSMRSALGSKNLAEAAKIANTWMETLRHAGHVVPDGKGTSDDDALSLLTLFCESIFKSPLSRRLSRDATESKVKEILERPLNTMGMVPNSGKDVGGTPVMAETPIGAMTLCIEVPHASEADKKKWLADPSLATHFNPVFVAAEIPSRADAYKLSEHPFWIVADKKYQGRDVYYHESLMYEILGNSTYANCSFVEIPRKLFNPHKTVDDIQGRSLRDWV